MEPAAGRSLPPSEDATRAEARASLFAFEGSGDGYSNLLHRARTARREATRGMVDGERLLATGEVDSALETLRRTIASLDGLLPRQRRVAKVRLAARGISV